MNESDWRPIETAPKDGERVLLLQTTPGDFENVSTGGRFQKWRGEGGVWFADLCGLMPTHWMPLPPPPKG